MYYNCLTVLRLTQGQWNAVFVVLMVENAFRDFLFHVVERKEVTLAKSRLFGGLWAHFTLIFHESFGNNIREVWPCISRVQHSALSLRKRRFVYDLDLETFITSLSHTPATYTCLKLSLHSYFRQAPLRLKGFLFLSSTVHLISMLQLLFCYTSSNI